MTAPEITAFDVCGELPTGTTVLEASAGTGKTFTIAALAARYVAEGRARLPDMLLVTFGRAATAELRERVRERLVDAERGLADPVRARASGDTVLRLLADVDAPELALRRRRLAEALADFDSATIATTHQFCHRMLAGLGVAADTDPDAAFSEDFDDLVTEVVDDLYLRKYAADNAPEPLFSRATALNLARVAVEDPQARLEPADAALGSEAQLRYRFACAVRDEVRRRKRQRRLYGYDDMLTRLADALTDPVRGPDACARLRERYAIVLVDEFQDTDPVQWDILRTAFHGHTTLVLIGDPKQAIYTFRGADVISYLSAAGSAGARATLGVNWRSDEPLLSGLETVFGGAALGDERIRVWPVNAEHRTQRLTGAPVDVPVRLRVMGREGLPLNRSGMPATEDARRLVAADVANEIAALLGGGAKLNDRTLAAGDVAVLVRTHKQGALVREALTEIGVPAVLGGTTSVFGSTTAQDWLVLLEGLEQPHRATRVAAASLTCFVGWSAEDLAAAGEELTEELGTRLRHWAAVLADRGVAALLEALTATGLPARLLAERGGERRLTDLRHIGLALHAVAVEGQAGLAALVEWLRHRIADAARDTTTERSRRLESDADAVQVITVHTSKGLEFPVVYVPFGWDRHVPKPELPLLHDDSGARVRDVGGSGGPGFREHKRRHQAEEAGEDLRLLYVALTRAQCQVVTWWAPTINTRCSALHRLLIGRPAPGTVPRERYEVPDDAAALATLRRLASPYLAVEQVVSEERTKWTPPTPRSPELAAAGFGRQVDGGWQRTSYSRLTAAAHDGAGVASEPEATERDDEAMPPIAVTGDAVAEIPSPMADLPSGATFGTLVHAVLENVDTTAPDLLAELTERAREQLGRRSSGVEPDALATALQPAVETPLGPLMAGRRLRDIAPADRLTELEFELPLAGGDGPAPATDATLAALGLVLRRHLGPGDPLAGYPDQLTSYPLGSSRLRGYLTGSIDAVLRSHGRYVVVDYKTNWLGEIGPTGPAPLTTRHYSPSALVRAMTAAHYPLQALLYSVALHRFLRWRHPGYEPEEHLGGVLYLFLRGMCGPDTPVVDGVPCGVFSWRPPAALVTDLSRLLDGEAP